MYTAQYLKEKTDRANRVHHNLSPLRQLNMLETEEYIIDRLHHLASQGVYQTDITFCNWEDGNIREMTTTLSETHNLHVSTTDYLLTYRLRWDI